MPPVKLSTETWNSLFDSVGTIILDCDGVLWLGNDAIKGSPAVISHFRKMGCYSTAHFYFKGKRVILLTNNSRKSQASYFEKCGHLGFDIDGQGNIVTTSVLTADYLKKERNFSGKVYVLGSAGVGEELDNVKIAHIGIGPDPMPESNGSLNVELDPEVKAVVVGFDHHFSYVKLMKAASYLKNPKCIFIATNDDERLPESERKDTISPGAGCFVSAASTAAGRVPIILGKPNQPCYDYIKKHFDIEPSKTLMIGDNLKTDIRFARNFGLHSLLVLSGESQTTDFTKKEFSGFLPEYFTNCLGDILGF